MTSFKAMIHISEFKKITCLSFIKFLLLEGPKIFKKRNQNIFYQDTFALPFLRKRWTVLSESFYK